MIAVMRADPADAVFRRDLGRQFRRALHHEMAHGVVAIEQRHRACAAFHADIGIGIETASLQTREIARQAEDTVAVAAEEIGGNHQFTDVTRVTARQAAFGQRVRDETDERVARDFQIFFFIHRYDEPLRRPVAAAMAWRLCLADDRDCNSSATLGADGFASSTTNRLGLLSTFRETPSTISMDFL